MKHLCVMTTLVVLAVTAIAYGQATKEFNWIPSGTLDVGNLESENASDYRGAGEPIRIELPYREGTPNVPDSGRKLSEELFTVKMSTFRGGAAQGALVIRRRIDTAAVPAELTIFIDGKEQGKWQYEKIEGNRRFADIFYVIPATALLQDPNNPDSVKWQFNMKLAGSAPYESFRYDFYVTRDWGFMPAEYAGAIKTRTDNSAPSIYLNAIAQEAERNWEQAIALHKNALAACKDSELARCIRFRLRLCAYNIAASKVVDTNENRNFDQHYLLGLYCATNGFWNEAMEEYTKAVNADPAHADATYNLGEAMEYCRLPVGKWAPLMGRAGWLYKRKDVNTVDAHIAINTYEIPDGEKRVKSLLTKDYMDLLERDWNYVAQMVFGSSRGAWKINTTFETYTPKDPKWELHLNWLWGPPTSSIPKWGMYDHTVSFAQWGASHCGGIDCGPAWSGCANIGPDRSWDVIIHEWNHQFDWTCISGEQGRAYAVTHDSDGCGKQPIVSMGGGHHESMRYYLRPAQYKRIEPSDADIPKTYIKTWSVTGPFDAPKLEGKTGDEILAELKAKKIATNDEIQQIKSSAEAEKKDLADKAHEWYWQAGRMDLVKAVENEAAFGPDVKSKTEWKTIKSDTDQINLAALYPKAEPKSFAYATTYIWSPEDREVRVWYGYHDGLRVWHNTRMVHNGNYYTCAYYADPKWLDMVAGHLALKKGWNKLTCKVERCSGLDFYKVGGADAWSFSVNLVTYDNQPMPDLKYQAEPPKETVNVYKRPDVGKYYAWDDVQEDYLELLPELNQDDFRKITSIPELLVVDNVFMLTVPASKAQKGAKTITIEDIIKGIGDMTFDGAKVTPSNFLDLPIPGTPQGQEPTPFNKFKTAIQKDVVFNNFLNLDQEGVGAFRYMENGKPCDLVFIRPEYMDEYLALIDDSKSGMEGRTRDRVLGCWIAPKAAYMTTGSRTARAVIVAKTYLGDEYPLDEQDILGVPLTGK
jgi:tetratricopeptide (TPR) repeat protein